LVDHSEAKNKEVNMLKNHVEVLQKEIDFNKKINDTNIKQIMASMEEQIKLYKERELFTLSQFTSMEDTFNHYKHEKGRIINLLREEVKDLKLQNTVLTKGKDK
jgi:hypothetical protein